MTKTYIICGKCNQQYDYEQYKTCPVCYPTWNVICCTCNRIYDRTINFRCPDCRNLAYRELKNTSKPPQEVCCDGCLFLYDKNLHNSCPVCHCTLYTKELETPMAEEIKAGRITVQQPITLESELETIFKHTENLRELLSKYDRHLKTLTKRDISEVGLSELVRLAQIILDLKNDLREGR